MRTAKQITERRIIRLPQTIDKTGMSRSTIRRMELAGLFPKRVRVGLRGVGHFEDEVDQHVEDSERVDLEGQEVA